MNTNRNGYFALLYVAAGALVAGCSAPSSPAGIDMTQTAQPEARTCGQLGCMNALLVEVQPHDLPPGTYVIRAEGDGSNAECTMALPHEGDMDDACSGQLPVVMEPSRKGVTAVGFESLLLSSAPSRVRVSISRDNQPLATVDTAPRYEAVAPNGPECEPECRIATIRLDVEAVK